MNIPNIITIIRIILVPIFVFAFFFISKWVALCVFILAGISDLLDGYIARKYNLVTDLGALLDPFADKLMLISVLVSFTIVKDIPIFMLVIMVIKELFMIYAATKLYFKKEKIVIPANKFGKTSTVLFYFASFVIIFNISPVLNNILMALVIISTILAFFSYYKIVKDKIK